MVLLRLDEQILHGSGHLGVELRKVQLVRQHGDHEHRYVISRGRFTRRSPPRSLTVWLAPGISHESLGSRYVLVFLLGELAQNGVCDLGSLVIGRDVPKPVSSHQQHVVLRHLHGLHVKHCDLRMW